MRDPTEFTLEEVAEMFGIPAEEITVVRQRLKAQLSEREYQEQIEVTVAKMIARTLWG